MSDAKDVPHLAQLMRENGIAYLRVNEIEIELIPLWHPPSHGVGQDSETDPGTPSAKLAAAFGEDEDDAEDMALWSAD